MRSLFSANFSTVVQTETGEKAYSLCEWFVCLQDNSCTCQGGEWLGDGRWCAADGIWDVPSPLTEEVLCHWKEEENKEASWPCHYWLGWGRPATRASERWGRAFPWENVLSINTSTTCWLSTLAAQRNNLWLPFNIPDMIKLCWAGLWLWRQKGCWVLVESFVSYIAVSKHGSQYTGLGDLFVRDLPVWSDAGHPPWCSPLSRNQGTVVSGRYHTVLNQSWLVTCYFLHQPCSVPPMNAACFVFQNYRSFSFCEVGDYIKPEFCHILLLTNA